MHRSLRLRCAVFAIYAAMQIVPSLAMAQIKRSRSEGLIDVRTSNTEGFSNIWISADAFGEIRDNEFIYDAKLGGKIGLASLMQLSGTSIVPKGRTLGSTEMHVQLTVPGNDNLRLVGFGASGDLLLSTAEALKEDAPLFKPYLGFTVMIDLDLVKKLPWFPFKLYANVSTLDDESIMLSLVPISLKGGLEYKGPRHSWFMAGALSFYREVPKTEEGEEAVEAPKFDKFLFSINPGIRYRIGNRMSVVARVNALLLRLGEHPALPQDRVLGISVRWETPIYFKDTNAEAIRSLVFIDRQKKKIKQGAQIRPTAGSPFDLGLPGDSLAAGARGNLAVDYFLRKEELRKRREKALEEMKNIEDMLE